MKLSATQVKQAKPKKDKYKLFDGGGMYVHVMPSGSKYWRMRYRFAGKDDTASFGTYPEVSLKKARERRTEARQLLADGIDPNAVKKVAKRALSGADSFKAVAREWHEKNRARWTQNHSGIILRRLERDVFPWIGDKNVGKTSAPDLLKVLQRIESRGAIETAHRVKQYCGTIFRYAIATGRAERDPAADLRGALAQPNFRSLPGITKPEDVGALMRAIDGYQGELITRSALHLAPLVFVRIGELRKAEWPEFDLDGAEWRIPGERMKMKQTHIVPLSTQAVAVLRDLYRLTGPKASSSSAVGVVPQYVFPSVRSATRPMSENTINAALRRMGYTKEEMTGHGFRTMASTLLNEQGWNRDAIERQLAHAERNSIRAAYNYAEYLPERRKMMQAWADYLHSLQGGASVIPIRLGHA